jgi:TRAP-type mannitol/chloroaromatic compound transport system permease small subunit
VTLLGDALLLLPFALVMAWFSWRFMASAWASGEGSSDGGLDQRWIIKAVLPLGFGLLALFGVARALRTARELITRAD